MSLLNDRWALPDRYSALLWCKRRNQQKIRCIIDVLGENAGSPDQAQRCRDACISTAQSIRENGLDASLSIKLTALGALMDEDLAKENALLVQKAASSFNVDTEIDMEGAALVDFTGEVAIACARHGKPVTIALQSYLHRTEDDIEKLCRNGLRIRLVKGAYLGDIRDYEEIENSFMKCFAVLLQSGKPFSAGTHDPMLLSWMREKLGQKRDLMEFGFLKGLADETKLRMAGEGFRVAEYIPFGRSDRAYAARREKYLRDLDRMNRAAAD
jgi:proline dehydrogenase